MHGAKWSDGKCWQAPIGVLHEWTNSYYPQSTLWQVRVQYFITIILWLKFTWLAPKRTLFLRGANHLLWFSEPSAYVLLKVWECTRFVGMHIFFSSDLWITSAAISGKEWTPGSFIICKTRNENNKKNFFVKLINNYKRIFDSYNID